MHKQKCSSRCSTQINTRFLPEGLDLRLQRSDPLYISRERYSTLQLYFGHSLLIRLGFHLLLVVFHVAEWAMQQTHCRHSHVRRIIEEKVFIVQLVKTNIYLKNLLHLHEKDVQEAKQMFHTAANWYVVTSHPTHFPIRGIDWEWQDCWSLIHMGITITGKRLVKCRKC